MTDDAAFRAFVVARSPGLLRTAYLMTHDQGLAEDLLQTGHPVGSTRRGSRRTSHSPDELTGLPPRQEPCSVRRARPSAAGAIVSG